MVRRNRGTPIWSGNSNNYTQDTFDLRVVGGSIEFDWIVDPSVNFSGNDIEAIHAAPLDEDTFVLAWCDDTENDITFAVYDTDGTLVTGPIDADAVISGCESYDNEVSVSAFNSTAFVIGWFDRQDQDATFRTYDTDGNAISSETDADTDVYLYSGVSVSAFNSTAFVMVWQDGSETDAIANISYGIYDINANTIKSQTNVAEGQGK
ncbi:MAG: hypothetical protein ABII03_02980, partial [Nanoarchaeota archaeon]